MHITKGTDCQQGLLGMQSLLVKCCCMSAEVLPGYMLDLETA